MLMFYLVNWPDRDIQRYSWQAAASKLPKVPNHAWLCKAVRFC